YKAVPRRAVAGPGNVTSVYISDVAHRPAGTAHESGSEAIPRCARFDYVVVNVPVLERSSVGIAVVVARPCLHCVRAYEGSVADIDEMVTVGGEIADLHFHGHRRRTVSDLR